VENPIASGLIGQAVEEAETDLDDGRAFALVAAITSMRG